MKLIKIDDDKVVLEINITRLDMLAILLPAAAYCYDAIRHQLNDISQEDLDHISDEFIDIYKAIVLETVSSEANA